MDRGAWWAAIHGGCKKSDTTEKLSMCVSVVPREMEWTNAILYLELPDYYVGSQVLKAELLL